MELMRGKGGSPLASGGLDDEGALTVQLKGGSTSSGWSGASELTEGHIHTHTDADRNTERQRDPETWRDTERLRGTAHAFPVLGQGLGPPTPLPSLSTSPKRESQASTLGFILGDVGVGLAMRRSVQYWAIKA